MKKLSIAIWGGEYLSKLRRCKVAFVGNHFGRATWGNSPVAVKTGVARDRIDAGQFSVPTSALGMDTDDVGAHRVGVSSGTDHARDLRLVINRERELATGNVHFAQRRM